MRLAICSGEMDSQINVTSDSGAMAQALARSFAEAVGEEAATDKSRY